MITTEEKPKNRGEDKRDARASRENRASVSGGRRPAPRHVGSFRQPAQGAATQGQPSPTEAAPGAVVGRNAVRELLRSGRAVDKIFVQRGAREGSITVLCAQAIERRIPLIETERQKLDSLAGGIVHQGIVALAAEIEYETLDGLFAIAEQRREKPLFVILDGIMDPNNLGAVIRTAEAAGAHGLIIPKRHSAGISPAVTKASAGAVLHLAVARVPNLAQTVDELKARGVWIYTAEADGNNVFAERFDAPTALVFGSEGEGVSHLIREKSDFVVSVPMYGHVNSLNVSAAAAVVINAVRAYRAAGEAPASVL